MRVYNFLSAQNALSNLVFQRLRVSRYADLNDPFELLAFNVGSPGIRKGLHSFREEFNKKYGLLCFSKSTSSTLLWSHYADKHRGFCLGFDIPDELVIEVVYSKDRIAMEFEDNDPSKGRLSERSMRALLKTKSDQWSYEEEVRMQARLEENEGGSFFYPFSSQLVLREVIVGAACDLPLAHMYVMLEKMYPSVELFKAALTFKWYAIAKQKVVAEKEDPVSK